MPLSTMLKRSTLLFAFLCCLNQESSLFALGWMAEPSPYYGHCCVRYRWVNVASEGVPQQCEDDGYILPSNITENVAHCLKYNDALRLGKSGYQFLTKQVSQSCESDVDCKYVLFACERDFCPPCPTMSPFAAPTFTPTLMTSVPTPEPRTLTKEPTIDDRIITVPPAPTPAPPTYQECQDLSMESPWNIPTPVQNVDNKQPCLGLRAMISFTGPDPRTMTRAVTPFVGQVVWTLTDNTQNLDGWLACDGSYFEPTGNMRVLGELLGGNQLPDCNQRILLGQTTSSSIRSIGGMNTLDISTLMPDSHIHQFNWSLSEGCNSTDMSQRLSLTLSDVASHNTTTFIQNQQQWIGLSYLITATQAKFADDPSRLSEDLIYGEIVMYFGDFIDEILQNQIFYLADGNEHLTSETPELAMVIGDQYDSTWHMSMPMFQVPDLSGKSLVHSTTGAEFGDPDLCYFGEDNFTLHRSHLGPHHHGSLQLDYDDSCTVSITIGDFDSNSEDCETLSNVATSVIVKYAAFHGSNVDPTQGHYIGAVSLFAFKDLPSEYIGLDGYEVMSMTMAEGVSRKFIVDADRVKLPQLNGRVAMHMDHLNDIGERFGRETLCNCEDLIGDHKHWIRSWCISDSPTRIPSEPPTVDPSYSPSNDPSQSPTNSPSNTPTSHPTRMPTNSPSENPTGSPTANPTEQPSQSPTRNPTDSPSESPSQVPTTQPTGNPTGGPTESPSDSPSANPTSQPTDQPSESPSGFPSWSPSSDPSGSPSESPTKSPSEQPSYSPTSSPTVSPSKGPSEGPTLNPTETPTENPTRYPSSSPTNQPSNFPTKNPTLPPTEQPTRNPSEYPTSNPTGNPSDSPTAFPTGLPSKNPTGFPSESPSQNPSEFPTLIPTMDPSQWPTLNPTPNPSLSPTQSPIFSLDCSSSMSGFCSTQSKPDVYSTDIDSMQAGVGVSMHIAAKGTDPRTFGNITDEVSQLTTPFIGQVLLSLRTDVAVDKDVESTVWLNCDGESYESSDYPELSEIINDGTFDIDSDFMLPDCRKRVLIGGSSVRYGGMNEFSVNSDIFVKHSHETSTQSDCDVIYNVNDDIGVRVEGTIEDTSCEGSGSIEIDRYDFDNRQSYLQLFVFVVARGKSPWSSSSEFIETTTSEPISSDNGNSDNQLVIGELVFSMFEISNEDYFLPCDGRSVSVSDFPELYSVIGLRYTSTIFNNNNLHPLGYFNIPDCRGRTMRNWISNGMSNSEESMYSGEVVTSVTSDNIAPHWHDPISLTFDQNPSNNDDNDANSDNGGSLQSTCDVWIFSRAKFECTNLTNEMPSVQVSLMLYLGSEKDSDWDADQEQQQGSITTTTGAISEDDAISSTLSENTSSSGQFDDSESTTNNNEDIFSDQWYQNNSKNQSSSAGGGAGSFTIYDGRFTGALYLYAFEIGERHGDYLPLRGYDQQIDENWCDESLNHIAIEISSDDQSIYIPDFHLKTLVGADPTSEDGIDVAESHGSDVIDCTKYDVMYPHNHDVSLQCVYPSTSPTFSPSESPSKNPTHWPSDWPTESPSQFPTITPTVNPTWFPTISPSMNPTGFPTSNPSVNPTESPTQFPTKNPTDNPTPSPSGSPNFDPTTDPTRNPTNSPSDSPSRFPSISPTSNPTGYPTLEPTDNPTEYPSESPSQFPTDHPTEFPTQTPTDDPTSNPSSQSPTAFPTSQPSDTPSVYPSISPISDPTLIPTVNPTMRPTSEPLKSAKDRNFTDTPTKSPVSWDCSTVDIETDSTLDESGTPVTSSDELCEFSNVQNSLNVHTIIAVEGADSETMLDDYGELRMPFIGQIILSTQEVSEDGFVPCDGRSVSQNGIRQVPDCRDRLLVGLDFDDFAYNDVGRRGGSSVIDFSELVETSSSNENEMNSHIHSAIINYSHQCSNDPILINENTVNSQGITVDNRQKFVAVNHLIVAQGGSDPRSGFISSNTLITGEIVLSIFDYSPNGFLPCEGQFVSKVEYPELYEIMGDNYTPEDQLNDDFFKLPDCRGRTLIGFDSSNSGDFDSSKIDKYFGMDEMQLTNDYLAKHTHFKDTVDLDLSCSVNFTIADLNEFCNQSSFDNRMRGMSMVVSQYLGGFDNMADQLSSGRTTYSLVYQTYSVRGLNFESNEETMDHALVSFDSDISQNQAFESYGIDQVPCSQIICDHSHYYSLQCPDPTISPSQQPSQFPTVSPTFDPSESPSQSPTFHPTVQPIQSPTVPPTSSTTTTTLRPSAVWAASDPTSSPEVCGPSLDGGWSSWSDWSLCRKVQFGDQVRLVRSRQRTCSEPTPQCGGCDCEGDAFEVQDCDVQGGCQARWTDWKDWSVCVIGNATEDCSSLMNINEDSETDTHWDGSISCQGWRMRSRVCIKYDDSGNTISSYNSERHCNHNNCECLGEYKQIEQCETSDCLSVEVLISDWAKSNTDWLISKDDMIVHRGFNQSSKCVSIRRGDCYSMWVKLSDYQGSFIWRYKGLLLGYYKPSSDRGNPFDRDEKARNKDANTDWIWKPMHYQRQPKERSSSKKNRIINDENSNSNNDEWSVDYHRDSLSDYVEFQGCIPDF